MQDKFVHSSASLWVGWFRNQKPQIGCNAGEMVVLEQKAIIIVAYPIVAPSSCSCPLFLQLFPLVKGASNSTGITFKNGPADGHTQELE